MSEISKFHEIVKNFSEISEELGRAPTRREYFAHPLHKFSTEQIGRYFGTWLQLTRAAGTVKIKPKKFEDPQTEPKILVVDLELLPMVLLGYGLYDQNFGVNQIMENASLASFAAQFVGEKDVQYFEVNWKKNPRDDRALTKKLYDIMNEADIVLGQNSDAFDVKVANERFLEHQLGPTKPVKLMDTKKMGKKYFKFPSNSLEYMSNRFCETKKMTVRKFPGILLQRECLAKNPEAWEEMRVYNIADVKATAELAVKFAPWASPDFNAMKPGSVFRCINVLCGSQNIIQRGWKYLAAGKYKQYTCNDCGKWFHEGGAKNNALSPNKRASLKGPV